MTSETENLGLDKSKTEQDVDALVAEMKQLRADFARVTGILNDMARHGAADARDKVEETAERAWGEAKRKTQDLFEQIEERPIASALVALGLGFVVGIIFTSRR